MISSGFLLLLAGLAGPLWYIITNKIYFALAHRERRTNVRPQRLTQKEIDLLAIGILPALLFIVLDSTFGPHPIWSWALMFWNLLWLLIGIGDMGGNFRYARRLGLLPPETHKHIQDILSQNSPSRASEAVLIDFINNGDPQGFLPNVLNHLKGRALRQAAREAPGNTFPSVLQETAKKQPYAVPAILQKRKEAGMSVQVPRSQLQQMLLHPVPEVRQAALRLIPKV